MTSSKVASRQGQERLQEVPVRRKSNKEQSREGCGGTLETVAAT